MEQETTYDNNTGQAAPVAADPRCQGMAELYKAVSAFQGELVQPEKNKTVTVSTRGAGSYRFKYADLGACVKAAKLGMAKNGLSVFQIVVGNNLVTRLAHSSGASIESTLPMNLNQAPQAVGSMLTYLKRYAYCAILGIVADDDDDANLAMGNRAEVRDIPKAPRPTSLAQRLAQLAEAPDADKAVLPLLQSIVKAETLTALGDIYKAHEGQQQSPLFLEFLTTRKKELTA